MRYGERARVGIALNGDVRIHVDDDGAGIAAEDRERIFEPFFRLEDSRSRDTGGIGLGLAIARTIIRAHGGEIDVTNGDGDGGGARFTVRLPGQG